MRLDLAPVTLDDICALILIIGCLALIASGRDGEIKAVLGVAAGWLFGKRAGGINGKG